MHDWKADERKLRGDFEKRMADMLPEPLFESFNFTGGHICLLCTKPPVSMLYSTTMTPLIPLCQGCAVNWRSYDYYALKRLNPVKILKWKLFHPFRSPGWLAIVRQLRAVKKWSEKMKRLMKRGKK